MGSAVHGSSVRSARAAFTLIEVAVVGFLLAALTLGLTFSVQFEARTRHDVGRRTNAERIADDLLTRLDAVLASVEAAESRDPLAADSRTPVEPRDLAEAAQQIHYDVERVPFDESPVRDDGTSFRFRQTIERGSQESTIFFDPVATIGEADRNVDVNGDGDLDDHFDLGALRQRTRTGDAESTEIELCPPILLQERGAWGSDLDGDGSTDPIFRFDPYTRSLSIRLSVLTGASDEVGVVSRRELELFLHDSRP